MTLVGSSAAMSFFFCRGEGRYISCTLTRNYRPFPCFCEQSHHFKIWGDKVKWLIRMNMSTQALSSFLLWLLTGTERGKSLIPISEHSFHIITELILLLIYLTRVKMEDLEHAALQENLASGWEFTSNHSRGSPPPPSLKMRCFPFRQLELDKDWAELGFAKTSGTVTRNRENRPFAIVGHVINFL